MRWWHGAGGRYNTKFALAVIKAKVSNRATFKFKGNRYVVKDHIAAVLEDIREGRYRIAVEHRS